MPTTVTTRTRHSTGERCCGVMKKSAAQSAAFVVLLLLLLFATSSIFILTKAASSQTQAQVNHNQFQVHHHAQFQSSNVTPDAVDLFELQQQQQQHLDRRQPNISDNGSRAKRQQPASGAEYDAESLDESQASALAAVADSPELHDSTTNCASQTNNKYRTLYACEGKQLHLECQAAESIQVIRANYGRFSLSQCNEHGLVDLNVNCMSPSSKTIIANSCQGKQSCQLLASNSIFGDPCPQTQKYLEVQYQCLCGTSSNSSSGSNSASAQEQHRLDDNKRPKQNVISHAAEQSVASILSTSSERPQWPASGQAAHLPPWMPSEVAALSTMRPPTGATANRAPSRRCPEMYWRHVRWPSTEPGQVATAPCPPHTEPAAVANTGGGAAAAPLALACLAGGVWAPHLIARPHRCQSLWLRNLTQRLEAGDSPLSSLAELVLRTRWSAPATPAAATTAPAPAASGLFGDDLALTSRVARQLVDETAEMLNRIADDKQRLVFAREIVQLLAELVNNLAADRLDAWQDLEPVERARAAAQLAQSLERAAVLLAGSQLPTERPLQPEDSTTTTTLDSFVRAADSVYLAVRALPSALAAPQNRSLTISLPSAQSTLGTRWMGAEQRFTLHLQTEQSQSQLDEQLQSQLQLQSQTSGSALKVVFVMLRGLGNQMETQQSAMDADGQTQRAVVNSHLVSMSIVADARYKFAPVKVDLSAPVELVFQHLRAQRSGAAISPPRCAYWDAVHSDWLTEGCKLVSTNRTHSSCACDHLTSFALLADSSSLIASDEQQQQQQTQLMMSSAELPGADSAANNFGFISGQNQQQSPLTPQLQQPKVQLDISATIDATNIELSLAPSKTLYLAKLLDGSLFADDSAAWAPNARLLTCASCLLAALLLALQLAAAAYNQTQTRRLLGAMPRRPLASGGVVRNTCNNISSCSSSNNNNNHHQVIIAGSASSSAANSDEHASPTYSSSDYSLQVTGGGKSQQLGAATMAPSSASSSPGADYLPLRVPLCTTAQLFVAQLLLVLLLESQSYLSIEQRNSRHNQLLQPFDKDTEMGAMNAPIGLVTWIAVVALYYLVSAFACWLLAQLARLNLSLALIGRDTRHKLPLLSSSAALLSSGSVASATSGDDKSAQYNAPIASIYRASGIYAPGAQIYGQQLHSSASPSASFSSSSLANETAQQNTTNSNGNNNRTLARLEDSRGLYCATSNGGAKIQARHQQLHRLTWDLVPCSLIEHALPLALTALITWLSVHNARLINALAYIANSSFGRQLAHWPLLVDASSGAPLALLLYYLPMVCVALAALAMIRLRRRRRSLAAGSGAIGTSIVNPYGSSSFAAAAANANANVNVIGGNNNNALNKQQQADVGANLRPTALGLSCSLDAKRPKLLCGWLLALLALHSICWISFFGHVHHALNTNFTVSSPPHLIKLVAFALANLALALLLTWLQRRSLRRAASLLGLGQALGRCCRCIARSPVQLAAGGSRARFYRQQQQQQSSGGGGGNKGVGTKVSTSSHSLFLAVQQQQQQQQQHYGQVPASGMYLYGGYPPNSPPQQHLYHQLGQPQQQQVHIYDSATNVLGDQHHHQRLNMMQQQQQQQQQQQRRQQQMHQMHQFEQHTFGNNNLNRSMSSLQQHAHQSDQRQPMTLKPLVNTMLPTSGQLLVLDAASALKQQQQQQQQQFAACHQVHLAAASENNNKSHLMSRTLQHSGEADGPLVAFNNSSSNNNNSSNNANGNHQPPTTFGPSTRQLLQQHQLLSGRPLFSQQQRSSPSPINCAAERSSLCTTSGGADPNQQQHAYCSISNELQSAAHHFRSASGKMAATTAQRHQSAMIDRGAANIYDVANYALGQ